jgi:hypothetical protein
MTGQEHFEKAEELLKAVEKLERAYGQVPDVFKGLESGPYLASMTLLQQRAQVYATLALAYAAGSP